MLVIHVSYKPLKCGAFTPVLNLMVRHYELVIMKRQREQGAKREINLVKIKHKGPVQQGRNWKRETGREQHDYQVQYMMLQTDRNKSFIHKHSSVQQSPNPYSPVQVKGQRRPNGTSFQLYYGTRPNGSNKV